MYADSVDRKDACARIGLTLKSLRVFEFSAAIFLEQEIFKHADELAEILCNSISENSNYFQHDTTSYRPTLELQGAHDSPVQLRKSRINQSLGFNIDLQEIALIPDNPRYPHYVIAPSISIGFDVTKAADEFTWAIEVMNQRTSQKSAWKYWLKVRTNAVYEGKKGIGFPSLSQFLEKILSSGILEGHIQYIADRFKLDSASSNLEERDTIIIAAATCNRSEIFSRLYLSIIDAGDVSIRNEDKQIERQFIDIEEELVETRDNLRLESVGFSFPAFFWCNLEEGFSGLFGEISNENTMIISGITYGRKERPVSLLEQDDPTRSLSNSALVTRALMNEIVRWY